MLALGRRRRSQQEGEGRDKQKKRAECNEPRSDEQPDEDSHDPERRESADHTPWRLPRARLSGRLIASFQEPSTQRLEPYCRPIPPVRRRHSVPEMRSPIRA